MLQLVPPLNYHVSDSLQCEIVQPHCNALERVEGKRRLWRNFVSDVGSGSHDLLSGYCSLRFRRCRPNRRQVQGLGNSNPELSTTFARVPGFVPL